VVVLILVVIALLLAIFSLIPLAHNYPLLAVSVILLAVALLASSIFPELSLVGAISVDLHIEQGADWPGLAFPIFDSVGAPYDLAGCTALG